MKLHLTKSLRAVALAACVCGSFTLMGQAMADELTGGTTYESVTAGTHTTTGEGTVTLSAIYVNAGDVSITGTAEAPVTAEFGTFNNSNTDSVDSFVTSKLTLGDNVSLTLTDGINMTNGSLVLNAGSTVTSKGIYMCSNSLSSTITVSGGTLKAGSSGTTIRDAKGTITISDGGTFTTQGMSMNSAAEISISNGTMYNSSNTNLNGKGSTITVGSGGLFIIGNGIEGGGDNDTLKLAGGTFGATAWGVGVNTKIDVTADSTLQGTRYTSELVLNTEELNVLFNLNKAVSISSDAALNIEGPAETHFKGTLTNGGTLKLNGGTTYFETDVTGGGAITIASGASLTLNSGVSLDVSEAITNNGTFNVNGTLVLSDSFAAGLTCTTEISYSDGDNGFYGTNDVYDLAIGGTVTTSGGAVKLSDGSEYALHVAEDGSASFSIVGTDNDGIYYVNTDASYSVDMETATNGVLVKKDATLTTSSESSQMAVTLQDGTLKLGSTWGAYDETGDKGTVTIDGSGTITSDNTVAIYTTVDGEGDLTVSGKVHLYAEVENDGNVTVDGSVNLGNWWGNQGGYSALLKNTGDVTINGSDVSLNSGSSIENSGKLTINEGAKLTVDGSSSIVLTQAITNNGTLVLNGTTIDATNVSFATPTAGETTYSDGSNGYIITEGATYTVINNGENATLTATEALVKYGESEKTYTLAADGTFTLEGSTGTVYCINSGVVDASLIDLTTATAIQVATGATLDLSKVTTLSASGLTIDLGAGAIVKLTNTVDLADGSLTLADGVIFDVTDWAGFNALDEELFKGVDAINGSTVVTLQMPDGTIGAASLYLENGVVSIPEPTTATLSLLALAGLAARRRRK